MNKEEIEKLEEKIQETVHEFSRSAEIRLEQTRKVIDEKVKDVINVYSNEIRNLALISGTVAPFSLTILSIEKLNANAGILLLGFSLLIANIILAQYCLRKQSKEYDTRTARAQINWFFAQSDLSDLNNTSIKSTDKVLKNFDYIKKMEEAEKLLGVSKWSTHIHEVRSKLRNYNNITNIIFTAGTACIILSVLINYIISWVV